MHLKVMLILFYIYVTCREDLLRFVEGGAGGCPGSIGWLSVLREQGGGFSGFTHLQLQGGHVAFQNTGQVQILPLDSQGHRYLIVACFSLHIAHGEYYWRKESKLGQGYSPAGRTQAPDLTDKVHTVLYGNPEGASLGADRVSRASHR